MGTTESATARTGARTPARTTGSATPQQGPQGVSLSADEARRIALRAQGFLGAPDRRAGVRGVLRQLGAVQLDTISVLARSHELVPYARLGAVGRTAVEEAYWQGDRSFEYWSHAACILPIEEWPLFAFRRRARRQRGHRWHRLTDREAATAAIRKQLTEQGPLTTAELGGGRAGGEWWDWTEAKIAVEWLLDTGEVVCSRRVGWRRVYDLAERVVPEPLFHDDLDDQSCLRRLVSQAGAALGVATRADLADYHRLTGAQVRSVLEETDLVPVQVQGWPAQAYAAPAALANPPRGRHRTTLLSPFDSLVWDRRRTERIFGLTHRLEAYVPRPQRVHGYFAMPVLAGGRLVGRVDPARAGRTLVARQLSLESAGKVPQLATALREAAAWVGCDNVRIERCSPEAARAPLQAELD